MNRVFYRLNSGRKRILTYHNVIPDELFVPAVHLGVSHARGVFEAQMRFVARRFKVGTDLNEPSEVTITFDDGYQNQYQIAHHVLKNLGLRGYFFCSLDLLDSNSPLLIDDLLCWFSYVKYGRYSITWDNAEGPFVVSIMSDQDRALAWRDMFGMIREAPDQWKMVREKCDLRFPFRAVYETMGESLRVLRLQGISGEALRTMRLYGHCIGAHSKSHYPMKWISTASVTDDFEQCGNRLERDFNTSAYSYPFGGFEEVSAAVVEQLKRSKFAFGLSNTNAPLPTHSGLLYCNHFLPRMALPNSASPSVMDFHLSGSYYYCKHRRLLPKPTKSNTRA